jgi:threonine dehydrogenase-like Zn-dependent dehydrogenase
MARVITQTMDAVSVKPRTPDSARLLKLPQPKAEPGTVLVRVLEVGIDGTDTEIDKGEYGEAPPGEDVLVIGHEGLGRVEAVGPDVTGFARGDLVVATVRRPDGCINCRAGESDMCLTGNYTERGIKGAHGYMAQFYAERPEFLIHIPEAIRSFAVLLEPLSIVEKAIFQAWKIQERMIWEPKNAVVLGAGPIGLLGTVLLRLKGLEVHVLATTPPGDYRSSVIESLGAKYEDVHAHPVAQLRQEVGQIDFILEATGVSTVAFQAMAVLGNNGVLCLTGVSGGNKQITILGDVINLGLVLGNRTVLGSVNANRRYFESGVRHFQEAEQRWPGVFQKLITRRVPFNEYRSALDRRPEDIKTLLTVSQG